MTVHVCAYAAFPDRAERVSLLQASCDRLGIHLHLFGENHLSTYNGKVLDFAEYLKGVEESHVLMLDGTDTLMVDRVEDHAGILFATEGNCWPMPDWAKNYPNPPEICVHPYLNSGCILGEREALQGMLEEIKANKFTHWHASHSDQHAYTCAFLDGWGDLDYWGNLCLCLSKASLPYEVVDGKVYIPLTRAWPKVLHYCGGVPGREKMWKELNR